MSISSVLRAQYHGKGKEVFVSALLREQPFYGDLRLNLACASSQLLFESMLFMRGLELLRVSFFQYCFLRCPQYVFASTQSYVLPVEVQ